MAVDRALLGTEAAILSPVSATILLRPPPESPIGRLFGGDGVFASAETGPNSRFPNSPPCFLDFRPCFHRRVACPGLVPVTSLDSAGFCLYVEAMPCIAPNFGRVSEVLLLFSAAGALWGLWMAGFANLFTRSWGTVLPSIRALCVWRSVDFLLARDACSECVQAVTPVRFRCGPDLEKFSGGN